MSKSVYDYQKVYKMVSPVDKDSICNYSGNINGSTKNQLIYAVSLNSFAGRKPIKTKLRFEVNSIYYLDFTETDSISIGIDVYTGDYEDWAVLTYNQLLKNYDFHGQIIVNTGTTGKYGQFDVSAYNDIFEDAFKSDKKYVIFAFKSLDANKIAYINTTVAADSMFQLNVLTWSLQPVLSSLIPNTVTKYKNKSIILSWNYNGDGSVQVSYQIEWSGDNGENWNIVSNDTSANSHTFAKEYFPEGTILWKVRATSEEGLTSEYAEAEFYSLAQRPSVSVEFPNSINIRNDMEQIFTWKYSGEDLLQSSYEIEWSNDEGVTWNIMDVESSEEYHIFQANTFSVGEIIWRIRVTNSDGYYSDYAYGRFESVGESDAPVIEAVTQEAIPTITWSTSNQEAFEIHIISDRVSYESGMRAGVDQRSFRPNIMLADGLYTIKIRILNKYGILSDWGESVVVLQTEKPISNPVLSIIPNELHGVTLSGYGLSGDGYFVRKEDGKETIVAKCVVGKEALDCDLQPGKKYKYVLRDYSGGYVDSEEKVFVSEFDGVIIQDIEDLYSMVQISLNESDSVDVQNDLNKNVVYKHCKGREYPVKESDEHKTESIVVKGFLDKEQYRKAYGMYVSDKLVLFRHQNHCCCADISNFKKRRYFDKGYIVEITFVRLDRDNEVELV